MSKTRDKSIFDMGLEFDKVNIAACSVNIELRMWSTGRELQLDVNVLLS